jgi:hypothetical protein
MVIKVETVSKVLCGPLWYLSDLLACRQAGVLVLNYLLHRVTQSSHREPQRKIN